MLTTARYQKIMRMFGQKLKAARERKYRSAEQFANKLGLEPHTYRKYERGETEPNFEVLTRICEDLGITPNDLLPAASGHPTASQPLSAA